MGVAAILLALAAWGLYIYRTLGQLRYVHYPVESYVIAAAAVVLGVVHGGGVLWTTLILAGLFVYWTAVYSNMPRKPLTVEVGDPAPDFTLPDARGTPVTLSSFRGKKNVLLIFYRGHW